MQGSQVRDRQLLQLHAQAGRLQTATPQQSQQGVGGAGGSRGGSLQLTDVAPGLRVCRRLAFLNGGRAESDQLAHPQVGRIDGHHGFDDQGGQPRAREKGVALHTVTGGARLHHVFAEQRVQPEGEIAEGGDVDGRAGDQRVEARRVHAFAGARLVKQHRRSPDHWHV